MTALGWITSAAALVAIGIGLMRWLRVTQREHYIGGSCLSTLRRWIRTRPPNSALAIAACAMLVATVGFELADDLDLARWFGLATATLVAVLPFPMPVRGTPPLRFTRRATTLAALTVVLAAAVAVIFGVGLSWPFGLVLTAAAIPGIVDLAATIAAPLERRALEQHRSTAEARLRRVDPYVIAVTGSWGKTSTKNHIRDLLTGTAEVVASPASWNNTAGLSRTVNEHLTDTTEILIAEMGTYGPGEIRDMCAWVRPRIGIICAIGPMHLERMRTIETIVDAKSEILDGVDTAILWVDDPRLAALAEHVSAPRVVRVGTRGAHDAEDLDVEVAVDDGRLAVWANGELVGSMPAEGGPHPGNLGCAVAASLFYGAQPAEVGQRFSSLTQTSHRAVAGTNDAGVVIIDDTFNSNPAGAHAAIGRLTAAVDGRRAVVTPGMVELGPIQDEENERFARAVTDGGATLVVVGWTNRRALTRGGGPDTVMVPNRDAARSWIREHLGVGDGVLWENDLPDHYP